MYSTEAYRGAYFDRLCMTVRSARGPDPLRYYSVLWQMHNTEFVSIMRLDKNRIQDALDFRARYLDDATTPVCIFELMVSLADRIETETMGGTVSRDRTAEWFWGMFASLGLWGMTDDVYDEHAVEQILWRFINRRYSPNGRGGLFVTSERAVDLREEEIWYQAALYLNDVLRAEGVLDP